MARSTTNIDTDVLVIGGNVAGSSVAGELARRGVKVTVVDRFAVEDIGRHSCGEGLEEYQFKRLGLRLPTGPFVLREIHTAQLVAPDLETALTVHGSALGIDRYKFNQWLVNGARADGARYIGRTRAEAPLVHDGHCVGAKVYDKDRKDRYRVNARVTIDASGACAVLRRKLPAAWPVNEPVARQDLGLCYRETRRLREPLEHDLLFACFSKAIAPGAIFWLGSRDERTVNVGIGVSGAAGHPNPKRQMHHHILPRYPILNGSRLLRKGGGVVPVRRPLDSMLAPGFIALGDAGCQTNPLSGSGIGTGIFAGQLAAAVITDALEGGKADLEALWRFNVEYNRRYGYFQAGNQVLRSTIQQLTDEELTVLFQTRILDDDLILSALETGEVKLDLSSKLEAFKSLRKHPRLLRALAKLKKRMKRARELYKGYPETPAGFEKWQKKVRGFKYLAT